MTDFTKTFHRTAYPLISPTAPAQDQSGRTILITGASEGLGYGMAEAFAQAKAAMVILTSRSKDKLDKAAGPLQHAYPDTQVKSIVSDASDVSAIGTMWDDLSKEGIFVDILILNAAAMGPTKTAAEAAAFFHFNVVANLYQLEHFQAQRNPSSRQKMLLYMTSGSMQCYNYPRPAYASSKAGFSNYLCHIADSTPETELRIIILHPGAVFTPAARDHQELPADSPLWDDPSLSAHAAVWMCGQQAAFLHGRCLWANWDVEELMGMREKILADAAFLKVGVTGVGSFTVQHLIEKFLIPAKET